MTLEKLYAAILEFKINSSSLAVQQLCAFHMETIQIIETMKATPTESASVIAELKEEIIKLRAANQSLNSDLNQQSGILNALRDILRINPEQPSTQLVALAISIMNQLDECRASLTRSAIPTSRP